MARRIGVCGMSVSAGGCLGGGRAVRSRLVWSGEPRPQSAGAGRRAVRGRGGRSGRSGPSPRWRPGRCPSRGRSCARSGSRRCGSGRRPGSLDPRPAAARPSQPLRQGPVSAVGSGGGGRFAAEGGVDVRVRLAVLHKHRDRRADLADLTRGEHDPADDPRLLRAVLDDRLLGLDLSERVSDGDGVAGGDKPAGDRRLRRAGEHARHPHDRRHQPTLPKPARTRSMPATTSSVRAIAARSSTFEMLGLASEPVTRCTGWSSQSKKRRWISSASQPP